MGYHFFIRRDGTLESGGPLKKIPAVQKGHNTGTIANCLHGLKKEKFTAAQFDKLKLPCLDINNAYHGEVTFHGHREVAAKACPVFDYKSVLRLDAFDRLGVPGATKKNLVDDTHRDPAKMPSLRRGDRGEAVALAQALLLIKDDGIFRPTNRCSRARSSVL